MALSFFITGTDTGVGKTLVATAFMQAIRKSGKSVAGFKPVSAGCERTANGLRNDDALALQHASSIDLPYELVNPYAFEPAMAPHIAARNIGLEMNLQTVQNAYAEIYAKADVIIIEGAGGWLVPFNRNQTMADVAQLLTENVILVVEMRLGCLNHALLTAGAIDQSGLKLAGWVANSIRPLMPGYEENLYTLTDLLPAPRLGEITSLNTITTSTVAGLLDLAPILEC